MVWDDYELRSYVYWMLLGSIGEPPFNARLLINHEELEDWDDDDESNVVRNKS